MLGNIVNSGDVCSVLKLSTAEHLVPWQKRQDEFSGPLGCCHVSNYHMAHASHHFLTWSRAAVCTMHNELSEMLFLKSLWFALNWDSWASLVNMTSEVIVKHLLV